MNKLPPLLAMRAFEAVGRTGSVREAAEELGVSSGAVTQHVHALESASQDSSGAAEWLEAIELTAQGKVYLPHLAKGFAVLRTAHDQLESSKRSGHLLISTYPSLATKWLGPLMFAWKRGTSRRHRHDQRRTSRARAGIRRGGFPHQLREPAPVSRSRFTHLFTDRLIVVAKSRAARAHGSSQRAGRPQEVAAAVGRLGQRVPGSADLERLVCNRRSQRRRIASRPGFLIPGRGGRRRRRGSGLRVGPVFRRRERTDPRHARAGHAARVAAARVAFSGLERRGPRGPSERHSIHMDHQ